jgi:hypothetical protein
MQVKLGGFTVTVMDDAEMEDVERRRLVRKSTAD